MTARVFVVGALHLDVIITAPRLPRIDETLIGDAVDYAVGGKGGNQALAAAQMGAAVSMAGRVGADAFGDRLHARLAAAGIDQSQVLTDPGASGMSAAIVDAQGDYGAVVVSGANCRIRAADIELPPDTGLVLLQNEIPAEVNRALAEAAHARGIPVMWNAAPHRRDTDVLPTLCRYLILNRVEAADMSGEPDPQRAAGALHEAGFASVIVTLGAAGLVFCDGGQRTEFPALPVEPVSSHGAGDMFCGALAARLVRGAPLIDALHFAQAAAALHVATPPAQRPEITPEKAAALAQSR
ncbi:MAG: PfkB family carbohydrate kinase [Rhodobacter sp.]|nr:PfkB family carbohydrate kinase [Rhodobacter sp.]